MKDGGYKYFIQILSDQSMQYEYRTMAAFVLSMLVDDYPKGQVSYILNTVTVVKPAFDYRRFVSKAMSFHCACPNLKSPTPFLSNGLLSAWVNSGVNTMLQGGVV